MWTSIKKLDISQTQNTLQALEKADKVAQGEESDEDQCGEMVKLMEEIKNAKVTGEHLTSD